ncbi:Prefoldin, subunit 4 [Exidia glandulosa HHB12029]|uniref:Prefoldin subunit 4 n=1 Tax=Exidia glandulosa HHB12029 TaxID=1314781 RepID=A0A165N4Q6_EXIGL|nr:Prefoldin, subunit 4 [Exidia glandulosa HHB12029]
MRMLSKDEESEDTEEVTWEDQQRINRFSALNNKARDVEDVLARLKDEKESLDDLASELELADEDDTVMFKIGETFVHLAVPAALERISQDQERLDAEIDALKERTAGYESDMKELKLRLYAKFGKQINLD